MSMKSFVALLVAGLVLLLQGCASSSVQTEHPLYISMGAQLEEDVATLYFIRPRTERSRGYADKAVDVKMKGKTILSMSKGEYTRIRIKPYRGVLTVASITMFAAEAMPREVERSLMVRLEGNQTYFIQLEEQNEEFRGIYTIPKIIDLATAKSLVEYMRPFGEAELFPLDEL